MIEFPNAKINLGLYITEKRPDGFHNLETVFYPLSLSDVLEISIDYTRDFPIFTNTGLKVDSLPENNLVLRAYNQIRNEHIIPNVHTHLHKQIPFGSGLGGGSSNAAYTIKMLNQLFDLKLSSETILRYARSLGSDCPFFLKNRPQIAYEKGDLTQNINISLKGYHLMLIVPDFQINTKEAYQGVIPQKPQHSLDQIIKEPISRWKGSLTNDFEKSLAQRFPVIEKIKKQLYEAGADYASLSGSGSAIYGIFKSAPPKISFPGHYWVWQEKLKF